MEELLNKLIKGWWKPRWENEPIYMLSSKKLYIPDTMEVNRSLRDLVSKESGLWQFVCENGMVEKNSNDDKYNSWQKNMYNSYMKRDRAYAKYRIIESALCDEDKLEKFLLDNIKI